MKAAVIASAGATPEYADFPEPPQVDGRSVVEVVAAGIHPVVRALVGGGHYGSSGRFPAIPGVDCVARTPDGRLVYTGFAPPPYGTLAERLSAPGQLGYRLPDGVDAAAVAGSVNPGVSTWLPLQHIADRAADTTVLITAATGMAGRLGVQNARALGVGRVIAVARNAEALGTLGADATIALTGDREADVAAAQAVFADGEPDLVLDLAWGWVAETLLEALVAHEFDGGAAGAVRFVHIGGVAGQSATVPGAALRSRPLELVGSGAGSVPMSVIMGAIPRYLELLADGTVAAKIKTFPLTDIAAAWQPETSGVRHVVVV